MVNTCRPITRAGCASLERGQPLEDYDWTVPTAVILGNEKEGVSDEARALADGGVYIPMAGFTESFNCSVAASMVRGRCMSNTSG